MKQIGLITQVSSAIQRIAAFRQRFGEGHFYLACHAALPLALTSDLLYCLWAEFQRDIHGNGLEIPWIAVADLLFSGLCEEVGYDLYEMEEAIQAELMHQLQTHPDLGQERVQELAGFVRVYMGQQLDALDMDMQDFAKTQNYRALAYTQPAEAAHNIAIALSQLRPEDTTEWIRMATLLGTLAKPLSEYKDLVTYGAAMADFCRGNQSEATTKFRQVLDKVNQLQVTGVTLQAPIKRVSSAPLDRLLPRRLSRRQFIQIATFTGAGIGVTSLLGQALLRSNSDSSGSSSPVTASPSATASQKPTLTAFEFTVITVDRTGKQINQQMGKAQSFKENLGNQVALEMVMLPSGDFQMGSPSDELQRDSSESPQHSVSIKPFFMGKYAITQAQWKAVAALPNVNEDLSSDPSSFKGDNRPVEQISWDQAVEFCDRLSKHTGRAYRLPSEAEWEYACRARTTTPFHFGETIATDLANYNGTSTYDSEPKGTYRSQTTDVGSFPPNSFGLYDMHGSVFEWCADYYHDSYKGAPTNGSAWVGSSDRTYRLLRGGSWVSYPGLCRSASRVRGDPGYRFSDFGFRVVCSSAWTL